MRKIFFIFFLFLAFIVHGREPVRAWKISDQSRLEIHGTSNVNSFTCASGYFGGEDVLQEERVLGRKLLWGEVTLQVKDFDCRNKIMNNDFRSALQAERHPGILIEFDDLKETGRRGGHRLVEGVVEISMSGRSMRYPIACQLIEQEDRNLLRGEQIFSFSDFGLEPPQKAFGMIRVNNQIIVNFELVLE